MAKKWEPPYQDRQPVIGLGYLEKNYGKDATEITEISLQGLLWTFFRLTLEISETSQDLAMHLLCNASDTLEIFGRYFG